MKKNYFEALFKLSKAVVRGRTTISNESISSFENGDFVTGISTARQFRKFEKDGNFEINFENGDFEKLVRNFILTV